MIRSGFDNRRDQKIADEYTSDFMPCMFCGCSTERATLEEYGARCGACYTQYVTGGRPNPPMPTRDEMMVTVARLKDLVQMNKAPGREWADKLKAKRSAGEKLSIAQTEALERFDRNTGSQATAEFDGAGFTPIPREAWPWNTAA